MESDNPIMNMTVEQFEQLLNTLNTPGGSYAATLIFSGIAALGGVIFVVWWVLNLRLAPFERICSSLEDSVKDLKAEIKGLNAEVNSLSKKIWEPDALDNKIKLQISEAIAEHEQKCSCRNCKNIQ